MMRSTAFGNFTVLLGLVPLALWVLGGAGFGESAAQDLESGLALQGQVENREGEVPGNSPSGDQEIVEAAASGFTCSAVLQYPDGSPVAGASVVLEHQDLAQVPLDLEPDRLMGVSSDAGRVTFTVPFGRRLSRWVVESSEICAGAQQRVSSVASRGSQAEEIVLEVPRGERLSGRVLSPNGSAVAGARVTLWLRQATTNRPSAVRAGLTDEEGRYEFEHVSAQRGRHVALTAQGGALGRSGLRWVRVAEGKPVQAEDLVLTEPQRLSGVVTDGRVPLEGVEVLKTEDTHAPDERVLTGPDGRFEFWMVGEDRFCLRLSKPGYRNQVKPVESVGPALELILDPGRF